jgi:hypothetical protein
MDPIIKLVTELELVRKIYPAIETGPAEEQLEKLTKRMQSEQFAEREPEEEPEEEAETKPEKSEKPAPSQSDSNTESGSPAGNSPTAPSKVDGVQHAVTSIDVTQPGTVLPQEN